MTDLRVIGRFATNPTTLDGDMWLCTFPEHVQPKRSECWIIKLPSHGGLFHTNAHFGNDPSRGQWKIKGKAPKITVDPSIDSPGRWHGWIKSGKLVDA